MKESFLDLAEIIYLNSENSRFYRTENGFPALEAEIPRVGDDLEASADKTAVKQDFGRVFFHRCFPFETPDEFISVLNREGREYGMIRDLKELSDDAREIVCSELDRKYLCPTIKKIKSLKERLGYSYWNVETDRGEMSFSMYDTYRNIAKVGNGMLVLTDVDGNRFEITDYSELDRQSYKKLELYL